MELLFDKWELALQSSSFVKGYKASDMVRDGFYPYYAKQNVKVMFIARESYSLSGSFIDSTAAIQERNYFLEQIRIVDPDIILTGNLEKLHLFGNIRKVDDSKNICYFELDTGTRKILLLDMWHFSVPSKSDERDYYLPLKQICQKYHLIS